MSGSTGRSTETELEPGDEGALQALLEDCSDHALRVTGHPTGAADALSLLLSRPTGLGEEGKVVLGAWRGGRLVGVLDLLLGHPDAATATIGVLLVAPSFRRTGVGRALAAQATARVDGRRRMRLGIVDTARDSEPFWAALGWTPEGDAVPYRYDHLESVVRHWTRSLGGTPPRH